MYRRSIISISAMTMLGLAFVSSTAVAQQKSLKEQLVGTWTLVSSDYTASEPGTTRHKYLLNSTVVSPRAAPAALVVVADGRSRAP